MQLEIKKLLGKIIKYSYRLVACLAIETIFCTGIAIIARNPFIISAKVPAIGYKISYPIA
jgi:hypothetical protein